MAEREGPEQPRRYCTSCGAEVRSGNTFCVSCGSPLLQEPSPPRQPWVTALQRQESLHQAARELLAGTVGRLRLIEPSRVITVLVGSGLLLGLLVFLAPLTTPVLAALGPSVFLVPLVVIAACGVVLLLEAGGTELRKRLGQILSVALAVYLFLSLYRVVLGIEDAGRRDALGFLLLVVALACVLLALLERGTRKSSLGGSSMGNALRGALDWAAGRLRALPAPLKVAASALLALTVLALLSPYVLVLGAVSVVVSAVALVVQAVRSRPWRQAGVVALTCVALTVIFGVVSDGIYDTGTGVEVNVTSVSEPDAEESGAPQYEETAPETDDTGIGATDTSDEANAETLLIMLQAPAIGMPGGEDTIVDAEVRGRKATVTVTGVSDEYAESVCRFALQAARAYGMASESNNYAGITEVTVKRPMRLWSAASCSV